MPHLFGVTFAVEEDVAPDPIDVDLFGADGVVLDAQVPAHAVEQFGFGRSEGLGGHLSHDSFESRHQWQAEIVVRRWNFWLPVWHSIEEVRANACPYSGKLVVVIHTDRGDNIRLISARPASRRERKSYEEIA